MKKFFLGTIILTCFAIAVTLVQISCQKSTAQTSGGSNYVLPPATTTTLGGVIVGSGLSVSNTGVLSVNPSNAGLTQLNKIVFSKDIYVGSTGHGEIWTANYDGSDAVQISITLPSGTVISTHADTRLSPDGKTIFFTAQTVSTNTFHIYSCNIDGSNVKKIIDGTGTSYMLIGGAY